MKPRQDWEQATTEALVSAEAERLRAIRHFMRRSAPTAPIVAEQRNFAFGQAAVLLAILVQIIQTGAASTALVVAIYSCALGIPFAIASAFMFDFFVVFGEVSYDYQSHGGAKFSFGSQYIASFAVLTATAACIFHLVSGAAYVFAVAAVAAYMFVFLFYGGMAHWVHRKDTLPVPPAATAQSHETPP